MTSARCAAAEIASAPSLAPIETNARPAHEDGAPSDETDHAIWTRMLEACAPLRTVSTQVPAYFMRRGIGADAEIAGLAGLPWDARELVASLLGVLRYGPGMSSRVVALPASGKSLRHPRRVLRILTGRGLPLDPMRGRRLVLVVVGQSCLLFAMLETSGVLTGEFGFVLSPALMLVLSFIA